MVVDLKILRIISVQSVLRKLEFFEPLVIPKQYKFQNILNYTRATCIKKLRLFKCCNGSHLETVSHSQKVIGTINSYKVLNVNSRKLWIIPVPAILGNLLHFLSVKIVNKLIQSFRKECVRKPRYVTKIGTGCPVKTCLFAISQEMLLLIKSSTSFATSLWSTIFKKLKEVNLYVLDYL